MPDSGLDRTVNLPDFPRLTGDIDDDFVDLQRYMRELHESIAAAYDALSKRINEFLSFAEWQDVVYPQITVDRNNFELSDGIVHRFSGDAAWSITGFKAPMVSRFIILLNDGTFDINLPVENNGSDAENRISTITAPFALASGAFAGFWYDFEGAQRWRQVF